MKPYYDEDGITIYHGDALDMIDCVPSCAVVSDPPYGMGWESNPQRYTGGEIGRGRGPGYGRVVGDDRPFDPSPWLGFPEVILFGANHFASRLPTGTTLVWIKRNDSAFGSFLSDAEIAWQKGGHGVYCFRDVSCNGAGANYPKWHPTQKTERVMAWCLSRVKADTVLDPFMGSGTTLVAAKNLGRRAIGIEIEERYCEIAAKRLAQGVLPLGGDAA